MMVREDDQRVGDVGVDFPCLGICMFSSSDGECSVLYIILPPPGFLYLCIFFSLFFLSFVILIGFVCLRRALHLSPDF